MLEDLTVPLQGGAGTQERAELSLAETTSPATHSSQMDAKKRPSLSPPGTGLLGTVIRPHAACGWVWGDWQLTHWDQGCFAPFLDSERICNWLTLRLSFRKTQWWQFVLAERSYRHNRGVTTWVWGQRRGHPDEIRRLAQEVKLKGEEDREEWRRETQRLTLGFQEPLTEAGDVGLGQMARSI